MTWRKQSPYPIHPKHFLPTSWQYWYLTYLLPTDTVMDVGCANLMHTVQISRICHLVIGFDLKINLLKKANAFMKDGMVDNIHIFCADANQNWCIEDNSFKVVIMLDVLEHLNNPQNCIKEIYRILEENGSLLISIPNKNTSWKNLRKSVGLYAYSDPDHKQEFSKNEITQILSDNGFSIVTIEPVVYDTWLAGPIDIIGALSQKIYLSLMEWKRNKAHLHPTDSTGFRILAQKELIR
jgi:2-polyprenyl-3-methyl-5-hydroxy-6-metoxy-1,4-benzoquinol methylase